MDPLDGFGILVSLVLDVCFLHCCCECKVEGFVCIVLLQLLTEEIGLFCKHSFTGLLLDELISLSSLTVWVGGVVKFSCVPCSFSAILGKTLQVPIGQDHKPTDPPQELSEEYPLEHCESFKLTDAPLCDIGVFGSNTLSDN